LTCCSRIYIIPNLSSPPYFNANTILKTNQVEAGLCYTGDVSDPSKTKYDLDYYLETTRELVGLGIHVLGVKDMAGLLKPRAATLLIGALREEFPDLPIHVHTHDTAGTGVASMLACAHAGADAVDAAIDSMSGLTSQPSMGAIVASLQGTELDTGIDPQNVAQLNDYWEQVRGMYAPLESGQKSGSSDVFHHEMPGGQYTNLLFQSQQLGLSGQWPAVKHAYADANELMGDIVKVTPSSKVVGDLAQFMVANELSKEDVLERASSLSLPSSVVEYFQGYLGIPAGGFPEPLRSRVLENKPLLPNGKSCFEGRPGAEMPDYDFDQANRDLSTKFGIQSTVDGRRSTVDVPHKEVLSHVMYPAVYDEWKMQHARYGDVASLPTHCFLQAMQIGEKVAVNIDKGKTLYIEMRSIGPLNDMGERRVFFLLNGESRFVWVTDKVAAEADGNARIEKADKTDSSHVGAPMPGVVVKLNVKVGERVEAGQALVTLRARPVPSKYFSPRKSPGNHPWITGDH
jgi:pyruvate carboxylase